MAYDALDQLIQANKSGSPNLTFAYDDQGRRIKKTGSTTTHYLYNGSDIHAEYASPAGSPTAIYAHGPSMDDPIARLTGSTNTPNATAAYYHQDGLGSAVATTDVAGAIQASQRFDAWGNRVSGTGTVPQFGYTGREPDESGLVFYRARYYDPQVGRFTQRDPLGSVDGFNTYGYAAGNPVLFTDPEGTSIMFASAGTGNNSYVPTLSAPPANFFTDTFVGRVVGDMIGKPLAFLTSNNVNPLTNLIENFSGDKRAEVFIGVASLGIGGGARVSSSVAKELPQVLVNKARGDAFRDEIANLMQKAGRDVVTEVTKNTPFGKRVIDIEVSKNGKVLGGIETKTGNSPYTPSQRAKDEWLRMNGYQVDLVRKR